MPRVAIFIDGAYLQYTLKHEFNAQKIDFSKLVHQLYCDERTQLSEKFINSVKMPVKRRG